MASPMSTPCSNRDWGKPVSKRHCPVEVAACIRVFEIACRMGDMHGGNGTIFELNELPRESVGDYAQGLLCRLLASPSVLFCAIVLLSRCPVRANSRTAHLLLLTAITVAHKLQSDSSYGNSDYAAAGRVPLRFINRLERAFLVLLDFRLCVTRNDFELLLGELRTLKEGDALQEFYSTHKEKHREYLRAWQLPQSPPLPAGIPSPSCTAQLGSAASASPSISPSATTCSRATTGRTPQPPSLPPPSGRRPSRSSARSAGLASGPAGGRGGLPRARQVSLPASAAEFRAAPRD